MRTGQPRAREQKKKREVSWLQHEEREEPDKLKLALLTRGEKRDCTGSAALPSSNGKGGGGETEGKTEKMIRKER